jgi:hypothetical protein
MFESIKKLFEKEVWALVKIIESSVIINKKSGNFYFRLYESNKGARNVEFACTLPGVGSLDYIAGQMEVYNIKIIRWKEGRYDPEIPRYNEVSEEDTMNALKGTV